MTDLHPPLDANRAGNNFGFLRLLFALLVIVAHSPYLIDGNGSREPWHEIFGYFTFGGLGVDGFFLISGYLITKSFEGSKSAPQYLRKRVLRIYPGFVVAYAISLLLVGPFAGSDLSAMTLFDWMKQPLHALILNLPAAPLGEVFPGHPFPDLNGAMWTIAYEFRCYLLVIALGFAGLLKRRGIYLAITIALVAIGLSQNFNFHLSNEDAYVKFIGTLTDTLRFVPIFLCGGAFYLFRDKITYTDRGALVAAILLLPMLFDYHFVEPGLSILGGYLLFWFAFNKAKALGAIGSKVDLSYGVYLYAWPIQKLLIQFVPGILPWTVTALTSGIAIVFAYASWTFVEAPFLRLKVQSRSRTQDLPATT
jgi:peptidoglycan/LPS O-acetylase OafA/YrhL